MCENFEDIDLDQVESVFRSNILQMFAITKYALPHIKKGGSYVLSILVARTMLTVYEGSSIQLQ